MAARAAAVLGAVLGAVLVATSLPTTPPTAEATLPVHEPIWDKGAGGERYVAFGDSFTSGPGLAPMRSVGCTRSTRSWPTQLATSLGVRALTDASCGGATSKHLWTRQLHQGGYLNPAQLDALGSDTSLVTFGTLGGNDIGLVQLALGCLLGPCVPKAGTDPLKAKFTALRTRLEDGLVETRRRAPRAEVVVVGYSTYLPKGGCPDTFGGLLTAAESDYVQGQIDRLSRLLEKVARKHGALFVDQRTIPGARRHTVCAAPDQQWLRAVTTYGDGIVLHPSACGAYATAQHVTRTIRKARGQKVPAFDGSCRAAGPSAADLRAERREALRAKAATARLRVSCLGTDRDSQTLRLVVRGGRGTATRVTFRVGTRKVVTDSSAPFLVKTRAAPLRKVRGEVTARVRFVADDVTVTRRLTKQRPRCLG